MNNSKRYRIRNPDLVNKYALISVPIKTKTKNKLSPKNKTRERNGNKTKYTHILNSTERNKY